MLHLQYFHNIFRTNHKWKVVIGSNLNSKFKLLFYPSVTTNNNLTFRICYENVVNITFLFINSLEKNGKLHFGLEQGPHELKGPHNTMKSHWLQYKQGNQRIMAHRSSAICIAGQLGRMAWQ